MQTHSTVSEQPAARVCADELEGRRVLVKGHNYRHARNDEKPRNDTNKRCSLGLWPLYGSNSTHYEGPRDIWTNPGSPLD
jgi:hypothetical protein